MSVLEVKNESQSELLEQQEDELLHLIQINDTDMFLEKLKSLENNIRNSLNIEEQKKADNLAGRESKVSWSMLQWACFHGNEKVVKSLLSISILQKSLKKKTKKEFFTPMHIAAQKNHLNICWLLLGASLQPPQILDCNENGDSEMEKTYDCSKNILDLLDKRDQWGNTTLHTCAANGYDGLVQWHLKVGADHTIKNKFNLTPLDVASKESCRSLLRNHAAELENDEDKQNILVTTIKNRDHQGRVPTADKSRRINAANGMLTKYFHYKSKLHDIIASSLTDVSKRFDLNHIHQLINEVLVFGLTKELIQRVIHRLEWLKARREILLHIDEVKSNGSPTDTETKYEYANDLNHVIQTTTQKEAKFGLIPEDLLNIIQDALTLCDRSNAEFHLSKTICQCQEILCADTSHGPIIETLDSCITKSKDLHADSDLIEKGGKTYARMKSELALIAAKESIPTPKLPVEGMANKQLRSYWDEEDTGHVKETEGFPLSPPGDEGYVWVKSEALQSLEQALTTLEECLCEAKSCHGNIELIESARVILTEKRNTDLKILLEKDDNDRLAAVSAVEKAAKKLLKKKKGAKKKAK